MEDSKLAELLTKACPRPAFLASTGGGPCLALSVHVLMVEAGFVLQTSEANAISRNSKLDGKYVPQKDWNGLYLDQWIFEYTKPGKARKFTVHLSLQAASKRMFVHCSEEANPANTCVLGLQLDNYVPEPARLKTNSWEGVVVNAAKMKGLLTEYIMTPLLQNAEDQHMPPEEENEAQAQAAAGAGRGGSVGGGWPGWLADNQAYILAGVAAAAVALLVVAHRSGALSRR
ncbi:hypothetical protein HXX76_011508 [Chlamydomonas incerta]|uniref:PI31 proteasome regulator N-terminal domain-containing protein n=1 Tax=Chlamydomonas incerta TaxID=51695 RepID=A0A835SSD9_CHLIN|nr:hypothetical protein HXX76_011508 [Chlamydomonas incerta]|eukprot:KAG2428808.1 hypothetical protein HXX76_011508 [Chlamydomonas incerta]